MTCEDGDPRLAGHLYGEGSEAERKRMEEHLSECPRCRARLEALGEGRRALDVLEGDGAAVDIGRLYRAAARRAERRAGRWKLAGAAAIAACALSGAVAVLRAEIEWRPDRVTVRWAPSSGPEERRGPALGLEASIAAQSARLGALEDLARALVIENETTSQGRQRALAGLEERLAALERQSAARLERLDRDVKAIYVTQFAEGR
jgi:hypothetical protein